MIRFSKEKRGSFCNMRVGLYYSYISDADHPLWAERLSRLPETRRQRVAARQRPADRARSVAVTALLQWAVTEWEKGAGFGNAGVGFCTVPATALSAPFPYWETDQTGRPFPDGIPTAAGRVWVSLSHSGGHLLVAVADRPVGADVQCHGHPALAPHRFRRLEGRIRHPAESPAETPAKTAARWAAKEAAAKLTGVGLATSFDRLQVLSDAVLGPDGTADPLFLLEKPTFTVAAVVKAAIPAG